MQNQFNDSGNGSRIKTWIAQRGLMAAGIAMFALIVIGSFLVINRLGQVHFAPLIGVQRDVVNSVGEVVKVAPPPPLPDSPEGIALQAKRDAYRLIVYFVAITTTGIPTLLTIILTLENLRLRNGAKAIMRIITMVWAILVTILCLFSFAMDFGADILAGFESVLNIAPAIFAMIGGLNLIAIISVILVSFTGSEEHQSVSGAVGGIMVWMSEFVLALAGFGFEAYYGTAIHIQPLVAALAAMLMSGGFVMSLAKLHDARRRRDDFDKRVWRVVSLIFVIYIGIVGATAGAHLSDKQDLIPSFILAIGERAFFFSQATLAIVLWIAKIYTDQIDWIDGKRPESTDPGWRLADRAVGAVEGARRVRAALKGGNHPALPAPVQFAKLSENGKPYDITGEIQMPDRDITQPLGNVAAQARAEVDHPKG